MAKYELRIPKEYQQGLVKMIALTEDSFNELLEVIEHSPMLYAPQELTWQLVSKIKTIPQQDAISIIATLLSLYRVRADTELSPFEFTEDVLSAIKRGNFEGLDVTDANRNILKDRLSRILGFDSLYSSAKAVNILIEHEHAFQDARILTDIRPVFGLEAKKGPIGAVIVNMLKISYREDRQYKEFFLSLYTSDLQVLIDVFERAKSKTESIESFLEGTSIPYVKAQ